MVVLSLFGLMLARLAIADIPNTVTTSTECKTCPYTECPNKQVYTPQNDNMTLHCWAEGTEIVGDTTWLKTNDSCYVTQYDLDEYAGDYTEDLPFCGYIEPKVTYASGHLKYYSECYYNPRMSGAPIKLYKYGINLDLTCVMPNITERTDRDDGSKSVLLGKAKWYKTTSNCYVHETTLDRIRGESDLDDCGPIFPFLAASQHEPDPTTSADPFPTPTAILTATAPPTLITSTIPLPSTTESLSASAPASSNATSFHRALHVPRNSNLNRRMLWETSIGEEYVNCTLSSESNDRANGIKRVYQFNQTVIPQCGTVNGNSEIMLFTTDFCWIKDDEVWEQMLTSYWRMEQFQHCEYFTDVVT